MADLLARLQPIFHDVFNDPKLVITERSSGKNVEDWDSLAHINLVSAIEQELKIRFALGELEKLKDVGDMIALIEKKLAR